MYQPVAEEGIDFVNFNMVVKSLCLSWIGRLISDSGNKCKAIPKHHFQIYGGLPFLLKCNYNVALLNKGFPFFNRELLQYFQELKNITKIFPNDEFGIWNDKLITVNNDTVPCFVLIILL